MCSIATTEGDNSLDLTDFTNTTSNTFVSKLDLPNFNSKTDFVLSHTNCMRVRYIGPLLDRAGVCYVYSTQGEVSDVNNISEIAYHPHCHIAPVGNEWIYVREKKSFASLEVDTESNGSPIYSKFIFQGLPVSTACLFVEVVSIIEFKPVD